MFLLSKHPLVLSLLLITAASPVASAVKAFETKRELKAAADSYCAGTFNDESTYGLIENWDVSRITDMEYLFYDMSSQTSSCNPKIGSWDVSKVTDFGAMFAGAFAFNQDISNWNVSSGENFSLMFHGATAFNQDISKWNVRSGTFFAGMFGYATAFNQDISNWNVSSGMDFGSMFDGATAFNQDISNWNISSGVSFGQMFQDATSFNQPLIYCKWQSNSYFKNSPLKPCNGSVSCGWGLSECPFVCVDSPLKFQVETVGGSLLPFSCKLAEKNKDKLTCSNQGHVATHCPKVCGKCSEYECSDAEGVFFMMGTGKERECSWLKEMTEDKKSKKCKKTKIAQTCRETCKSCE